MDGLLGLLGTATGQKAGAGLRRACNRRRWVCGLPRMLNDRPAAALSVMAPSEDVQED